MMRDEKKERKRDARLGMRIYERGRMREEG